MAAGTDASVALGLLQLKDEVAGFGRQVMRRVSEWRSGLSRFSRSKRLVAAHAVLAVSSYFEALGAALGVRLSFTAAEQVSLAAGGETLPPGYARRNLYGSDYPICRHKKQCARLTRWTLSAR